MAQAYETYATAIHLAVAAHNDWRRIRTARIRKLVVEDGAELTHLGDGPATHLAVDVANWRVARDYRKDVEERADKHRSVKAALTKATKAAMMREDAKAQYRKARKAARFAA